MERIPELADMSTLKGEALECALAERIARATVYERVERLTRIGIGAHRIVTEIRELMDDPWVIAHGLSLTRPHDGTGLVRTTGLAVRLSRTPLVAGAPAPKPAQTRHRFSPRSDSAIRCQR